MVGDSGTDVRTARAAAVPIVAVDFGYSEVPIAQLKPDRLIGSFAELLPVIADIEGRGILTAEWGLSLRDNEHPAAQPVRTEPRDGRDT
ncbi:MAG TPA: hypothetical protein VEK31_12060 [Xanthobacteraceae bacterium]|nr:hypothetical protein [Xanthobacteraceae bacterium]